MNYKLGDQSKVCTFDVCENFDELNIVKYLENIKLGTITKACDNDTIDYYLENFPSKVLKYNWENKWWSNIKFKTRFKLKSFCYLAKK